MKTGKEICVEKATAADAALVVELLAALYLELGEEAGSIRFLDEALVVSLLASGQTAIYFAKTNGETAGLFTLTTCQAIYAGGPYGIIDEMYVRPEHRSGQVGSAMISKVNMIAAENKWKRVDVTAPTEERWKRTIRFYERNGFVFTGTKLKLKLH